MRENSDYIEEIKQKYSLFQTEKPYYETSSYIGEFKAIFTQNCFLYLNTYNTLEAAQIAQKENKNRTLILPSY